jgi:CxxC-x17-CxxC domain-containing protein
MADYNRRNPGNNRNFGKPRFNRERSEMFSATCANCGKQCEVPFRPTGNKPVLCRECFQNNRGSDFRRSEQQKFDRPSYNRDNNQNSPNYQAQFDALNTKMDQILNLLTQRQTEVAPLESEISEEAIEEIVDDIQEGKKEISEQKSKKGKTKKIVSSKKK